MKQSKSTFDTGNWSDVNGLPGQQDMLNFLEFLTQSDPDKCYTRRQLMDEVAKEFEIPTTAQEASGPDSVIAGYYTRLTFLISDAVYGIRRANGKAFLKRIRWNVYQHATGNGEVSREMEEHLKRHGKNEIVFASSPEEDALHFFKHARKLQFSPETARSLVSGHPDWTPDILTKALNAAFA